MIKETTMNFSDALNSLKKGDAVRRAGWDQETAVVLIDGKFLLHALDGDVEDHDDAPLITQADILADDWLLHDDHT